MKTLHNTDNEYLWSKFFFSYITPRVHLFSHLIILICLLRCSSVHHYTRFSINTVSVCRNQARNYMYNEWTPPNSDLLSHYTIQFFLYRSFLIFSKYTITYVLMREWGVGVQTLSQKC